MNTLITRLNNIQTRIEKAWGFEDHIFNADYCIKRMTVNPGGKCSVHKHIRKREHFTVIGEVPLVIWLGMDPERLEEHCLLPGDTVEVPPAIWHSFAAMPDLSPATFLETSSRDDPDDSIRFNNSVSRMSERIEKSMALTIAEATKARSPRCKNCGEEMTSPEHRCNHL